MMTYTPFDLSGKTALITGGNSGIGLGMAKAVAAAGADVSIWGTNPDKNQAAKEVLETYGPKITSHIVDVSDSSAVDSAFEKVLKDHGRVDTCFANAGMGFGKRFVEMSDADWRLVMSVNLDGAFYTLRAAARHMVKRAEDGDAGGRLIATSSLAAIAGQPLGEAYSGTKGALISIMQALAVELGRYKITANSILPGHIETPMTEQRYGNDKRFVEAIWPRLPIRRWGTGDDFGGIAVYLMSDASQYHTGTQFLIDGGFFMS
ncbi:MAG: SDR family oxidoreductase [Desulfobacteraceae bacterium]|nr:SDR family oxidoreductase [Desulfobacteraceae bacterium]